MRGGVFAHAANQDNSELERLGLLHLRQCTHLGEHIRRQFTIDLDHSQAWNVVQELGYVLNYLSLNERLPTVFMPVSPPPYMNGPAREFLSWVIESKDPDFTPATCVEWLRGRLPNPVDDLSQWPSEVDEQA